ncbi:unnamed protein product [Clonostachys chloroleuca]|uniref:Uncharacterized protein n=1 Tax=Clonostachys chloroleuca TaxID=1926264 RepID=A0AA35Q8H0_9HYPO|nr:unnamed protein product [Clonostachys chloroleuca]
MCNVVTNYYIYAACRDPGVHFYASKLDGQDQQVCGTGPHERCLPALFRSLTSVRFGKYAHKNAMKKGTPRKKVVGSVLKERVDATLLRRR